MRFVYKAKAEHPTSLSEEDEDVEKMNMLALVVRIVLIVLRALSASERARIVARSDAPREGVREELSEFRSGCFRFFRFVSSLMRCVYTTKVFDNVVQDEEDEDASARSASSWGTSTSAKARWTFPIGVRSVDAGQTYRNIQTHTAPRTAQCAPLPA